MYLTCILQGEFFSCFRIFWGRCCCRLIFTGPPDQRLACVGSWWVNATFCITADNPLTPVQQLSFSSPDNPPVPNVFPVNRESSNNHALVAEMCKKSYVAHMNKTKSMFYDAAELPPSLQVDKLWFRKTIAGSSSAAPCRRYLAKGWEPKTPGRRRASTGVGISPLRAARVSPINRKRKSNPLSGFKNDSKKKTKVAKREKLKQQSSMKSFLQAEAGSEDDDDLLMKKEENALAIFEDDAEDREDDDDNDAEILSGKEGDAETSRTHGSKSGVGKHGKSTSKENAGNAPVSSEAASSSDPRRRRRRRGNY
jgi:hypothetical protein